MEELEKEEKNQDLSIVLGDITHFIKPHIITEMGIKVKFYTSTIGRSPAFHVSPKDVNNSVLNFLSDCD